MDGNIHTGLPMNGERPTRLFLVAAVLLVFLLLFAICGCMNPNTGSSTVVGDQISLPEISDSADSVSVRVYESVKGAKVWTAKDSVVTIDYACSTTNSYFGIVETTSDMKLSVTIDPLSQGTTPTPEKPTPRDN